MVSNNANFSNPINKGNPPNETGFFAWLVLCIGRLEKIAEALGAVYVTAFEFADGMKI